MTMFRRRLISIFLLFHLMALAVSAIPDPKELRLAEGVRESPDDAVSARVTPVLDSAARSLDDFASRAWQLTTSVRPLARRYVVRLGLEQNWSMFGNPPRGTEYLRFRYYSASGQHQPGAPLTVTTELVFPVAPEKESQIFSAYWYAHRDKAISNALIGYFRDRLDRATAGQPLPTTEAGLDPWVGKRFVPVASFFADRFAHTRLPAGERLVKSEAWYGLAASPPRGDLPLFPESRARAIERYHRGIPAESVDESALRPVDSIEREADIVWLLVYIQTP